MLFSLIFEVTPMLKLVRQPKGNLALASLMPMKPKPKFFADLVKCIDEARKKVRAFAGERPSAFWEMIGFQADIRDIVEKHTRMNLMRIEIGDPAIYAPTLSDDHIFMKNALDRYKGQWEQTFDPKEDVRDAMVRGKIKSLKAEVDVTTGCVGGFYQHVELHMFMCPEMFKGNDFSTEEIAAIMLHEFGHAFTGFLYLNRTLLTNQILAPLARTYEGTAGSTTRQYIFEYYVEEGALTPDRVEQLKKCKNAEELTVTYLNSEPKACQSELGYSLYDVSSCEALADQYASNCGAGVHLAKSLDRLYVMYNQTDRGYWYARIMMFVMLIVNTIVNTVVNNIKVIIFGILGPMVSVLMAIFMVVVLTFSPDKNDHIYDNPYARLNRIRQNAIERIKSDHLSAAEKAAYLKDIEMVDAVIHKYSDGLRLSETLAYLFRPSYREAHNYELLQKELESLSANRLFVDALKLRS